MSAASKRLGCAAGMEPDFFSNHCSVPAELQRCIGFGSLIAGSFLVASEIYLNSMSINPSWTERALDDQISIVLRWIFCFTTALTFGAPAYWPHYDDTGVLRVYLVAWMVSGVWFSMRAFRSVRKGFELAFALVSEQASSHNLTRPRPEPLEH